MSDPYLEAAAKDERYEKAAPWIKRMLEQRVAAQGQYLTGTDFERYEERVENLFRLAVADFLGDEPMYRIDRRRAQELSESDSLFCLIQDGVLVEADETNRQQR